MNQDGKSFLELQKKKKPQNRRYICKSVYVRPFPSMKKKILEISCHVWLPREDPELWASESKWLCIYRSVSLLFLCLPQESSTLAHGKESVVIWLLRSAEGVAGCVAGSEAFCGCSSDIFLQPSPCNGKMRLVLASSQVEQVTLEKNCF